MPTELYFVLDYFILFVKSWWWIFLPLILWKPALFMYLNWRIDIFLNKQTMVILEIKMPKDLVKPIRAMEVVLSGIHAGIYQPPDFWEKWIDGQVQLSLAIEMVSIDGQPHFYIRTPSQYRDTVESSIYAQYPEVELNEVEDYTKHVPQSVPNKEWDLFGTDYKLMKEEFYPIKTYPEFEKESALESVEEKKVDPIAALLEGMAKIKKGEQLWLQFILEPVGDADMPKSLSHWYKKGETFRDKLARRPGAPPPRPVTTEALDLLITGHMPEQKKEEKEIIPPEMKLTPGERDVLAAIEKKMSKPIFRSVVRFIFLGQRNIWFKPNFRVLFSYFNQYATNNLNGLFPLGSTLTKVKKSVFFPPINVPFIRNRRIFIKGRRLFRVYLKRLSYFHPHPTKGTYMLNTEELASLFHLPSQQVASAPGMERIDIRKKTQPPGLPMEE